MMKRREIMILCIAVFFIIGTATLITVAFMDHSPKFDKGSADIDVPNSSFGLSQAVMVCDQQIAYRFGERIIAKDYTDFPDQNEKENDNFRLTVDIEVKQNDSIREYSIICMISALANRIEVFEAFQPDNTSNQ